MPSQAHPFFWRTIHVTAYPSGEVRSPLIVSVYRTFCGRSFHLQNNSSDGARANSRTYASVAHSDSERNSNCFRLRAEYLYGPAGRRHGPAHHDLSRADFKSAFFARWKMDRV